MATLEQFGVLLQITDQTFRLVRDMRSNATAYIAAANRGTDPLAIGLVMKQDADEYLVRLDTLTQVVLRNQPLVASALGIIGVTLAQANALKTTLTDAANHTKAAVLTTAQNCIDEANAMLAAIPTYERLF